MIKTISLPLNHILDHPLCFFSLLLDPFFIHCKGPHCQLNMRLVHLKEVIFSLCIYQDIIWFFENTALTVCFLAVNETCVYLLQQKYESKVVIRRSR